MGEGRRHGRRGAALATAALGLLGTAVAAGPVPLAAAAGGAAGLPAAENVEDGKPPPALACRYRDRENIQSQVVKGKKLAEKTWPQERLGYLDAHRYTRGAGSLVAVVDTGVDANHVQLKGAVVAGQDVTAGATTDRARTDCGAHGTEVAGIVAARPAPGVGLVGIAPEAQIYPVRYLWGVDANGRETVGPVAALQRGMMAAVMSDAKIVNVSSAVAADGLTTAEKAEFARIARVAAARDVLVVAASGNRSAFEGKNPVTYPAALSTTSPVVMAVSSIAPDGTVDDGAISGPFVSVAAPGEQMPCLLDHGGVVPCSGTSFAAPFVSGLAALVRARFPGLTAAQVRARIEATADRPSTEVPDPEVGFGVINPVAALTTVLQAPPTVAAPVAAPPLPRPPSDAALRRTTTAVASGSVALVALVLAGWATLRRGRRRGWRPGRIPAEGTPTGPARAGDDAGQGPGEPSLSPPGPAAGARSG